MSGVILLLGSNIGDSYSILSRTRSIIQSVIGNIEKTSQVYLTEAWGYRDQPPFLNQAIIVSTRLSPQQVLKKINHLEKDLGRVRMEKWRERTIDIDIIYYDQKIIEEPDLKIPHPEMQHRKFVMVPVAEIAAEMVHPLLQLSNQQLLEDIKDPLRVEVYERK